MKRIVILLIAFFIGNIYVFAQEEVTIDLKNAEIHDILEHLKWGDIVRSNSNIVEFQFDIDENGKAINIKMPENISDSINRINHSLLSQLGFSVDSTFDSVRFLVFSSSNLTPSNLRLEVDEEYEKELKRFSLPNREQVRFVINDRILEVRPFHYRGWACGSGSLSLTVIESPLLVKLPKRLPFPNK